MSRTLSTIGWLVALAVVFSGCASNNTSDSTSSIPTVTAESVTEEEVTNYARAVMAIEQSRQNSYSEIQQIINEEQVPNVTCTEPDTITALPRSIQTIAVNYCNNAKKIGETHGLTMAQFNTLTVSAQVDPNLQRRIQNELIRLQQ